MASGWQADKLYDELVSQRASGSVGWLAGGHVSGWFGFVIVGGPAVGLTCWRRLGRLVGGRMNRCTGLFAQGRRVSKQYGEPVSQTTDGPAGRLAG